VVAHQDIDAGAAPDHDIRAVLRITAFRRLWLALAGSSFGDWLGLLATAALAQNLAGSSYAAANFAVAGVFITRLAPAVLLGPFAGALADRLDRRWTLVLGDLLRFGLFLTIPLVGSLTWLYVATVLIECVALFWMPAKDATVPNLVPRNRLEAANQISLAATYGTAPLAALAFSGIALLNGILDNWLPQLATNPVSLALYVNAATFLVSGLVIWRLEIPKRKHPSGPQVSLLRSILDGWRFIGSTAVVRGLILGMLGAFAAAGFVIGLAPSFVRDLGAGQPGFGVLFGAVFVGLALGMWVGPRLLSDLSRRRLFGLSLTTAGVSLAALALVPNIVMATLFTTAVGACGGVAWVTGLTLLGLEVDDEVRGRTFAFLQSSARVVLVLVLAVASTLAGLIGEHTLRFTESSSLTYNGAAWVFLIAAFCAVIMGVTAYRQMDDRPGTPLRADLVAAWQGRHTGPAHPVAKRAYPGLFIAFEGGDGTGKSTQAGLLGDWLRDDLGHDVVLTREPGATPLGTRLRDALLSGREDLGARAEALLFAADRAHHVTAVIRPALDRGAVVVTDRYMDSSIAYQGSGRELEVDDVARLSRWATRGLVPDLTVLLDLPADLARGRRAADSGRTGEDRLEALPSDFHVRVQDRFLDLSRREPHRYLVLDARADVMPIQEAIRRRVLEVMPASVARRGASTQEARHGS
jgi:dTMP kinase